MNERERLEELRDILLEQFDTAPDDHKEKIGALLKDANAAVAEGLRLEIEGSAQGMRDLTGKLIVAIGDLPMTEEAKARLRALAGQTGQDLA